LGLGWDRQGLVRLSFSSSLCRVFLFHVRTSKTYRTNLKKKKQVKATLRRWLGERFKCKVNSIGATVVEVWGRLLVANTKLLLKAWTGEAEAAAAARALAAASRPRKSTLSLPPPPPTTAPLAAPAALALPSPRSPSSPLSPPLGLPPDYSAGVGLPSAAFISPSSPASPASASGSASGSSASGSSPGSAAGPASASGAALSASPLLGPPPLGAPAPLSGAQLASLGEAEASGALYAGANPAADLAGLLALVPSEDLEEQVPHRAFFSFLFFSFLFFSFHFISFHSSFRSFFVCLID
jgi:hypothetical protein